MAHLANRTHHRIVKALARNKHLLNQVGRNVRKLLVAARIILLAQDTPSRRRPTTRSTSTRFPLIQLPVEIRLQVIRSCADYDLFSQAQWNRFYDFASGRTKIGQAAEWWEMAYDIASKSDVAKAPNHPGMTKWEHQVRLQKIRNTGGWDAWVEQHQPKVFTRLVMEGLGIDRWGCLEQVEWYVHASHWSEMLNESADSSSHLPFPRRFRTDL